MLFACLLNMRNMVVKKSLIGIPPWVILGAVLVLMPIFAFMTFDIIHRQKENTTKLMVEKGAALIRSFEAGARMGMMGMRWCGLQVQLLLAETAQQPDIVYLMVTDEKGVILAHNDVSKIGQVYGTDLDLKRISHSKTVEYRKVSGQRGSEIFEIFRQFSPTIRGIQKEHGGVMTDDWCQPHMNLRDPTDEVSQAIIIGLNIGPVEVARKQDVHHTIVMAAILLLIGFAGIVSLFLAHAYRSTRASLSRVKAFSDNLVENMPAGLLAVDADGRIVSFNQTAESLLGISSLQILGRKADEILPRQLFSVTETLKSKGGIISREIECLTKDGNSVPLDVSATLLYENSGVSMGCLILFRDLTEVQFLKKEVERSERLASIGRLAAGIAHEIRNPLSSIKGFATYFKERYKDIPEDQKTAEVMVQEVERLNRVIGQLLEFARPMSIRKRPISLKSLMQQSIKMIEGEAKRSGIELKVSYSTGLDEVWVDPDRMKQVFLNLYLNALESMEDEGTLSVEISQDENTQSTQIIISDTGTGINQEDLPHVFDPYFTTKSSGTGLGLAIVHNILVAHGGEARVLSRPGEGTRIHILFPSFKED
jgi:two-component system sensor histidine kinase HydH